MLLIMNNDILGPLEFPKLEHSPKDRPREFNIYSEEQRACCVYAWLVKGMDFRTIDRIYLGLTDSSKGFQSMGICHYLGLRSQHQGFYSKYEDNEILLHLSNYISNPEYCIVYYYILDYIKVHKDFELTPEIIDVCLKYNERKIKAEEWIINTLLRSIDKDTEINKRLFLLSDTHFKYIYRDTEYRYGKEELYSAMKSLYDFKCQVCGDVVHRSGWSSFFSRKVSWRFLDADIYHVKPLAKGGPDIKTNMMCLCPSCHRKFITGQFRLKQKGVDVICMDESTGVENLLNERRHFIDLSL